MKLELRLKLRENKILRILAYPWKQWHVYQGKTRFCQTEHAKRLEALRNIYKGKRCFIIGNGPSLTVEDLEALKGEATFAANRIYRLYEETDWRPTFWMCVDPYILKADCDKIEKLPGIRFVSDMAEKEGIQASDTLYMIHNHQPYRINKYSDKINVPFSEDVSKWFEAGETVTYNAIQLAVYMGFQEIYLLGVDHNYSQKMDAKGRLQIDKSVHDYFGNVKTEKFNIQNYPISTKAYYRAREYTQAHGQRIFNATRGGKLEVFPRVCFDALIGQGRETVRE